MREDRKEILAIFVFVLYCISGSWRSGLGVRESTEVPLGFF